MEDRLKYQLSEKEYKEFVHWYYGTYIKLRKAKPGKTGFSYLKEPAELALKEDVIQGTYGACQVYLLYSALEKLYELETLFVFFDMKRFWAVPKRVLGSAEKAVAWRGVFESRIKELGKMRISFQAAADACADGKFAPRRYVRQIDQVKEEYGLLHFSKREMEQLRRLGTFPYRMIGEQMLAAGKKGLIEVSERAVVLHPYENITGSFYTKQTLYFSEKEGDGLLVPLSAVGGMEGAEALMHICDTRCRFSSPAFRLKKKSVPLSARWNVPGKAIAAGLCTAAAVVAVVSLGKTYWGGGNRSSGSAGVNEYIVSIPEDTVFDEVTGDGTFVSSNLYYRMVLPQGEYEVWQDKGGIHDSLKSDWGSMSVTGGQASVLAGFHLEQMLPKTREEYQTRINEGSLSDDVETEVTGYSIEESGDCIVVSHELRRKTKEGVRSELGLQVYGPERYCFLTIIPAAEDAVSVEKARSVRKSFRIADMTSGVWKEMDEKVFHGYYGDNIYMTSCIVLLDHTMSDEEIGKKLDEVKKIRSAMYSMYSAEGDTLAVTTPDSRWLGIDCPSLQQNCSKETAKEVARIFEAEVILYDEFDGDLLMVAGSDAERKHAYGRATAGDKWILETEFQCYGKEQDFPEALLKYMDISEEEAEAIWKSGEYVFQMEKWGELAGHMTKMPVPEEFIGMYDVKALDERFHVIRR